MDLTKAVLSAKRKGGDVTTVKDVFSTYLYAGNGATQNIKNGINLVGKEATTVGSMFSTTTYTGTEVPTDIVNGIDLATDGGLVWQKSRGPTARSHALTDTERGANNYLSSDGTAASNNAAGVVTGFNTDGFSTSTNVHANGNQDTYVSWTFKKAPKFFDVVTYTGDGIAGRTVPHSLGVAPGMIVVKSTSNAGLNWFVYHRSEGATKNGILNGTNTFSADSTSWNDTEPTDSVFYLGTGGNVNLNGAEYVAYLYAHDPAADGNIQCGSYTGAGSGTVVNFGFKPQYVLIKNTSSTTDWVIFDAKRGMGSGLDSKLTANTTAVELTSIDYLDSTDTGFITRTGNGDVAAGGDTYIYMAIRAPEYDGSSGGLTWWKSRTGVYNHYLADTEMTPKGAWLRSDTTDSLIGSGVFDFHQDGMSTTGTGVAINAAGQDYTSWTFRKAEKFFDVVTWSGNGTGGRDIPHSLGITPGMIIVKRTNSSVFWPIWHNGLDDGYVLFFDTSGQGLTSTSYFHNTGHTDTTFRLGSDAAVNANGGEYVAYLFAHDTDIDTGMIQCGSLTTTGSPNRDKATLGWEPQHVMVKRTNGTAGWTIADSMRGVVTVDSNGTSILLANSSAAESTASNIQFEADGFTLQAGSGDEFIYMAIRAPMDRVPESADEVFAMSTADAGVTIDTGFAPDFAISAAVNKTISSRLTGRDYMFTNLTNSEVSGNQIWDDSTGLWNQQDNGNVHINLLWKRAKGFFDVVAYTGNLTITAREHSLAVPPEMIIVKSRSTVDNWYAYHKGDTIGGHMTLNLALASTANVSMWNNTLPTDTVFTTGFDAGVNTSGTTYIAYLFATLAGISKVGSYTGDGTATQDIDCGFSAGARFVLTKRTDSTGDWHLHDTVRGIVTGDDPVLFLNTAAAQITTQDNIDPLPSGFTVPNTGQLNLVGAEYIFYAIA